MKTKILAFADYHLGVKNHGKLDPETGLNTREVQTLEVLDEIVNYAINNEVEVIVAAGDMYKNNLPSPTIQNEFNKRIKIAADNNITVLILDGNHDVGKMDTTVSAMKPFTTLNIPNVIHTRWHKEYIFSDKNGNKIKFVFLPTYHTKEEINAIVDGTEYDGYPIVYIGHMTLIGALSNDWLVEDREVYIDHNVFNKKGVSAVILGHLHKHQILNRNPLIFYTGSTQRIDFNEENQDKGFVVLSIDKNGNTDHEFIEVKSQKFCTLKFDFLEELKDKKDDATSIIKKSIQENEEKIKDSIFRMQVVLDDSVKINEKEIYEEAYLKGATSVLNIQKTFDVLKTTRNAELTEHVSIERGLEVYYKGKKRRKERIKLGKGLIEELKSIGKL